MNGKQVVMSLENYFIYALYRSPSLFKLYNMFHTACMQLCELIVSNELACLMFY